MTLGRALALSLMLLAAALVLSVAVGPVNIPPRTIFSVFAANLGLTQPPLAATDVTSTILLDIRLPHAVLLLLTGAALAGSGASYQGLFRNPLADPYLIGVASGAGLGAVVAMSIRWPEDLAGLYVIPAAAFIGAALTVMLVYSLARIGRSVPTTTLILAGVAVSSFATSLTSFLMLRSNDQLRRATGWLLGGSLLSGWQPVIALLPYVTVGLAALIASAYVLNVLQFGEEQAAQMGLPAERVKFWLILAASLTTASAVAFSGIIGFIGLMVPHLVRLIWGADYRRLLPLSVVGGGTALLLADLLARTVIAPQVLPVGIVTALAGAPFFLWVLRRSKNQGYW
ncbi:MAG TPA: iron ABC transporter permease [Anaerolineales bacterium]